MRGHAVFIAQHATATCCRECLRKHHGAPEGVALTEAQVECVVELITAWIARQLQRFPETLAGGPVQPSLFPRESWTHTHAQDRHAHPLRRGDDSNTPGGYNR